MASKIDFSVVVTVLNEEQSITSLLDSLAQQTLLPSEIIIVDAGSTDATVTMIKRWKTQNTSLHLTLMEKPGSNRSQGRNIGINTASNLHIAVTDAGCIADKEWLKNLEPGFANPQVQIVAGFYHCRILNNWQRVFSWYLAIQPKHFNERTYLPSSRSLAFTKSEWLKVGKYPEHLDTCEDLVFAQKLKATGKMAVAKEAVVEWKLPGSILDFIQLVSSYAEGDVRAGYIPHLIKHALVWLRYGLFFVWPSLFLGYLFYPVYKFRLYLPSNLVMNTIVIQIAADLGVVMGGIRGLIKVFGNTRP